MRSSSCAISFGVSFIRFYTLKQYIDKVGLQISFGTDLKKLSSTREKSDQIK